jgi:hypothetical protein
MFPKGRKSKKLLLAISASPRWFHFINVLPNGRKSQPTPMKAIEN